MDQAWSHEVLFQDVAERHRGTKSTPEDRGHETELTEKVIQDNETTRQDPLCKGLRQKGAFSELVRALHGETSSS